jgi:hypothetical protein
LFKLVVAGFQRTFVNPVGRGSRCALIFSAERCRDRLAGSFELIFLELAGQSGKLQPILKYGFEITASW